MRDTRGLVLVLAVVLVVSMGIVPVAAGTTAGSPSSEHAAGPFLEQSVVPQVTHQIDAPTAASQTDSPDADERPADPTTDETIGYVEGYWYDDDLPVDDREDATLEADELESVVYRSMARVEVLRDRPFEAAVPVDIVSRAELEAEMGEEFEGLTEADYLHQDVRFEALFMADRETNATEAFQALFGGVVAGFYDHETGQASVVSDDPDDLELDEVILGHELYHALQDQYYDLRRYEAETRDRANAYDGLIEGDASRIETEYERRCQTEWTCIRPTGEPAPPSDAPNLGMYLTLLQPYEDGIDFVRHLEEAGGPEAVDDAYDDPPMYTSEIIHPAEYGSIGPVDLDVADRSSDRWEELEIESGPDRSSFGEAAMATMFATPGLEGQSESVVSVEEFIEIGLDGTIETVDYDHPVTDGWAGDELVTYVTDAASIEESGYVWHTEWQREEDAAQFLEGYLELLEIRGGDVVDGAPDDGATDTTVVIDERFPGAYNVDQDGDRVRIVRAPSVDELEEIHDGISLELESSTTDQNGNESAGDSEDDSIPGFGVAVAVAGLVGAAMARRR